MSGYADTHHEHDHDLKATPMGSGAALALLTQKNAWKFTRETVVIVAMRLTQKPWFLLMIDC